MKDADEQLLLLARREPTGRGNDQKLPHMPEICTLTAKNKKERYAAP